MCVSKISFHFLIFAIFLATLNGVMGKRGCASFGHSCYGGHGKRSQQEVELFSRDTISDKDISRHSIEPAEQFSSIYDAIGKPENDFKSLLRKLAKFYEENTQSRSKSMPKYLHY